VRYLRALRSDLRALDGLASFYDATVPADLVLPQFYPANKYSTVLWLYDPRLRFDTAGARLYVVRSDGHAVPAGFNAAATATLPSDSCTTPGHAMVEASFAPSPSPDTPGPGFVRLTYEASTPGEVSVRAGTPGRYEELPRSPVRLQAGTHTLVADLPPSAHPPLSIRIEAIGSTVVCVHAAAVGDAVPGTTALRGH
jgi:hypothetical protein